ncbi:LPD5 domain-containing protein [Comamonas aquatica]|uniref:LPD38 domain-containing protein n=1 Tax=Comamonas aquatica TaxID=225991 RepID=UPI002446DBFC|nr:LPD38 domain-containing protein [Comamonas aquatica]MDH1766511.1 LPD5 domain-containing protein [Comamonas aquatica]
MSTPNPYTKYATDAAPAEADNPYAKYASANPAGAADAPTPKRSLWAAINDTVIEGANAAAGTASAIANFVRPGNAASQWVDKNIVEAGEAAQSDVVKAEKGRYAQEMQDADGMVGEVGATLGYVARNPLLAAAQAAGSFATPGLSIKGATAGTRALGLGTKGTTRAGLAAGAGVGAAGAGGDAAGTAYELSREGGATDEQALAAGRSASVLPAAIGAAGGLVGAERLVAGARGFKGGRVARALKTGAVESAPEALEEGVTQYEGRRAAVPFNPDLDPMKGVAGAATMGGVLGAATGAGTSLLTRDSQAPVRKPSEDLGLDPSNGPLSKAAAAAVDEGRAAAPMQPEQAAQPEDGLSLQPVEQPEAPATPSMAERLEALPQQARAQADQLLREIADERTPEGVKRFRANELQQLLDANPMPQVPSMDISQEDRIATGPIVRGFDPSTGQAPARPLELADAQPQYEGGIDFEQQPQAEPSSLIQLAEWYERSAQANRDAANPVGQVQQQVRQGTQYTDAAQVLAARQAVEDAWLSLNVGESVSQAQADGGPGVEAAPADLTAETNARLRAGRVASGVRNAFDDGAPNTLRVIQHVNQGLRTIGEQPLTSPEIARIRRLADARTAFAGLNQRADLPADPAPAVDANADNSAMEALIPERPALQPAMEQATPAGAADPAQRAAAGNADIAGDRVGGEWVAFGPSSGTLGVPRAQMPQVDAAHRGALVNYLKGQGIASEQAEVPANSLKPTQAEFSEAKVRKASKRTGGDRAILVSSDGYVVDGHHQWLAKRQDGQPVKVLQLQAPISQLLPLVGDFPSARTAEGAQATSQGQPSNGPATPLNDESQTVAPSPAQSQAPAPAFPQPAGVADATQATQAQQTGAQPQAPGAATAEGAGQAAPAQATPVERKRSAGDLARSRSYAANPMRAFLGKHGVSLNGRSEFAPGLQELRGTLVPGYGPMFRKNGKPLDTLVQNAVEEGFLPEGATESDLYDLIDRAVRRGERVAPMYTESAAESEFEAMAARQAEFAREDYEADRAAQDAEAAEYDAVLAQEFVGLNDKQLAELDASAPDLDAGSNTTTEAAMRALGFSEKEIQDAVAREQGVAPEARQRGSEAVQADTRGAQARTGASQGDALQSYTEAELKQRQEAQEKAEAEAAKAEREAAAKEKAERERKEISARQAASAENFQLGQDPMASLSGQTSIFDAPPQPVVQAAPAQPQQAQDAAEINAEPSALDYTPKQYAEAWLKWSAESNGLPLAEVREMQGDEAGLKAIEQRWVDAVVQEAKSGKPLPRKTLDKLLEVRPNTTLPESAIPDGYQRQEARKAEKDEAAARKTKPATIEDVGEKIGGARKDVWSGFRDDIGAVPDDAIAEQPLSKVWPQPDYQKLIDAGHDAGTVAMVRSLRDAIPSKPRQSFKVHRWAAQVKELRAFALEMLDGQMPHQKLRTELLKAGSRDLRGIAGRAELYEAVGHGQSLEGITFGEHFYTLYKGKPNVTLWAVEQAANSSSFGNWPRELATGDTKEQALEAFKKLHANQAKQEAKANVPSFDIWSTRRTGEIHVGKKIGRNYAELAGPFKTVREAREYRDQNLDALTTKLEKYKEVPLERADTNRPRVGQDMRQGLDVTPEQFREAFGFRGVEFGNWVEQGRRQQDLNDAFDALMDMAAVLQLPPKAISLNGELGLSFGARGFGGKNPVAAHYERGKVVINLTKKSGAGSLGHEWWHAVDNYFSRMRSSASGYMTESSDVNAAAKGYKYFPRGEGVRPAMIEAFGAVMRSINSTALRARSAKLDERRTKDYWSTDVELSARAFESYLIAKLEDQNASNDYLANVVDEQFWEAQAALGMRLEGSYPYAKAGEVPAIRAAFDHFFHTVETKETDKGVAMFSRTERPAVSNTTAVQMRRAMVQRTVGSLTQGWGQSPRITVVDSMNDPRVPEAVREADQAQRSQGATGEPEGFWYQDQVYLVASALPTSADATRVLYHEVLGHHGLRGRFGAELDKVLDQVAKLRPKDVAAKASEYGLDMGNPDHVAYAAEEVLAELAQTRPDLGFVQRAIAAIRNFLRSHVPGFKALELTDADIVQGYLLPARGWVERSGLLDAQEEAASSMEPAGQAFSRAPSVESAAFKRWYGDWQNAAQGVPNNDSINLDTRGERALNAVQREGSVGAYPDGATRVGDFTFPGASGPVGRDGAPARLFHGTRDDITAFDRGAASRKDNGWLGAGFYFTSEPFIADLYSGAKQGAVGRNTMPVYVAVRNPYVASHAEKAEMKHWTRERLEQHTQALIEQGYDGVVLEGDGGVIELVAFEPTQVKSAIGNNGNYDPANPDIRYSRSQPADAIRSSMGSLTADQERKASWAAPSASQWDDLTYKLQDKHIDTKRVLESIRATGKAIGDDLDVYLQEELYHGRAAKRTEDFVAQELEPLVRYMSGAGLKMPELEEFLHARHAKEANAVIAQRNPDLPDGGSGMTNAEADAVMAAYSPTKRSLLGKAAEKVDAIIAQTRQTFVEYGLESQDTVDAWGQTFAHYVPLMREQEGDGMAGLGTGQGFSVKGKEVKGRTGSTKKVVDILANIAMQRERAIVRGEKNRVAAALVGLAKANPSGFWKVDVVPTRQVLGKDGMVKTEHDPLYKQRDNVVVAKIPEVDAKTGKVVVKEHAVLFDENDARALRMAQALKNLDAAQLEGMLGATAKVTRYLAAINTQYNPIFGVTNLARDLQGAAINLQSTELAGRHGEVLAQSLPALRGIYSEMRAQRKGETTGTPWSQLWEEFQGVGGQTGYRDQFRTSADRGEAIEKALDPGSWADSGLGKLFTANGALKVPMEFARKKAQWLFQWLEDYNTAMENGVRLATYKAGLDAGLSKERAASIAKNLTTNFNRKGQVAQQVGALYAFFNASMQGTARIGQALFTMEPGKPKTMRLSPLGKKVVFGGVTLGVMQALLLAAAGFDEGEPQEFVRERNLIIPVGGKKYITIPMPLGLHVLPNLGRIPAEFAMGGFQNPSATAIKVMSLFADAFNPMGSAGMSMQTLVPTVLDPLAALAENKDFSGRSIAKESFNQATPGHALGRDSASALATWVAQAINFLSGGTQYVRGEFSPTPDQIEYLVGQATGGVGRELLKLQSTAKGLMDGDEVPPHKVPLLGRFYGDSDTPSAKQATFYGHMDSVRRHAEQVKGLRLDGNASEALAYAASHPEARLAFAARKASQDVQKMRELRRELELQGASKEAIRNIDQRMVQRMELFNELVGRTVGAS